jgi:hypothetical protein
MNFTLSYTMSPEGKMHLTEGDCASNKETFEELFYGHVMPNRPNTESLLNWLDVETDFYLAPCSTIYHLNISGGLCLHSLAVLRCFDRLCDMFRPEFPDESRVICALLHDLCKVNNYVTALKSRKTGELWPNGKAKWEDYIGYDVVDKFPFGHGEKSVYLAVKHIPLTDEEAIAIRWHMGAYDDGARVSLRTLGNATSAFPVTTLLQCADMIATSEGF